MIFLQFRFQLKNRGMLPHDRDIMHHDRDRSSTSRALLGLTVCEILGHSRAILTIVTSCLTIVTMLTIPPHDRDDPLPARDLQKFLVSNWFIFGFWYQSGL